MRPSDLDVVTGAFGYTGRYIARRLVHAGRAVRTLTGHPHRPNPLGVPIDVHPYAFDDPDRLAESLVGARTLYNTYWVRFSHRGTGFEQAVRNSALLFRAAARAGVERVVHVSITNPSPHSPLPYFRGKAQVEQALRASGLSWAILRPTLIFGRDDILINNLAWLLRRFPFFPIPGDGQYRLRPVSVDDLAALALQAGESRERLVVDAVGPESFSFQELIHLIAGALGSRSRPIHVPPAAALNLARLVGLMVGDVVLTRDELEGLMAELIYVPGPPAGATALSEWLSRHHPELGRAYASELRRHFR
ncbi:MAG: NAD(P)H-binding protein [Actinomycetota bacterium]|nr:NAD(P)H-binding protein [Actinomycetota bacterium]